MSDNAGTTTEQDRSESSAKYKVGDRVKFVDEDCVVSGVTETLTGRWRYNIERNGVCIAVGVTENMLDPADDAVASPGPDSWKKSLSWAM